MVDHVCIYMGVYGVYMVCIWCVYVYVCVYGSRLCMVMVDHVCIWVYDVCVVHDHDHVCIWVYGDHRLLMLGSYCSIVLCIVLQFAVCSHLFSLQEVLDFTFAEAEDEAIMSVVETLANKKNLVALELNGNTIHTETLNGACQGWNRGVIVML